MASAPGPEAGHAPKPGPVPELRPALKSGPGQAPNSVPGPTPVPKTAQTLVPGIGLLWVDLCFGGLGLRRFF